MFQVKLKYSTRKQFNFTPSVFTQLLRSVVKRFWVSASCRRLVREALLKNRWAVTLLVGC